MADLGIKAYRFADEKCGRLRLDGALRVNYLGAMVERAILHIGFPKTGSTSLQEWLSESRVRLQKDYGICYPNAFTNIRKAHHELIKFPKNENIELAAEKILNEADGAKIIILSSEGWAESNFDVKRLRAFLKHLDAKEVHVVCYVREHLDYMQSMWRERVHFRHNFTEPFYIFSEANQLDHNMLYPALIRDMESVACVELVWYDKLILKNQNIISDFCSRTGVPEFNIANHDFNPSIGGNLLLYKIANNSITKSRNIGGKILREYRLKTYDELKKLARKHEEFRSAFFISKCAAKKFRKKSEYNAFFTRKIGPVTFRNFNSEAMIPDLQNLGRDLEIIFSTLESRPNSFLFDAIRETIPFVSSIHKPRCLFNARSGIQKFRADRWLARSISRIESGELR